MNSKSVFKNVVDRKDLQVDAYKIRILTPNMIINISI